MFHNTIADIIVGIIITVVFIAVLFNIDKNHGTHLVTTNPNRKARKAARRANRSKVRSGR